MFARVLSRDDRLFHGARQKARKITTLARARLAKSRNPRPLRRSHHRSLPFSGMLASSRRKGRTNAEHDAGSGFAVGAGTPLAPACDGRYDFDLKTKLRIAHALEYIAAQLGETAIGAPPPRTTRSH